MKILASRYINPFSNCSFQNTWLRFKGLTMTTPTPIQPSTNGRHARDSGDPLAEAYNHGGGLDGWSWVCSGSPFFLP
jgi:hypothetical protein